MDSKCSDITWVHLVDAPLGSISLSLSFWQAQPARSNALVSQTLHMEIVNKRAKTRTCGKTSAGLNKKNSYHLLVSIDRSPNNLGGCRGSVPLGGCAARSLMHLDRGREQTFIGIEASAGALGFQVHRHASAISIAEMTLQYIDTVHRAAQ